MDKRGGSWWTWFWIILFFIVMSSAITNSFYRRSMYREMMYDDMVQDEIREKEKLQKEYNQRIMEDIQEDIQRDIIQDEYNDMMRDEYYDSVYDDMMADQLRDSQRDILQDEYNEMMRDEYNDMMRDQLRDSQRDMIQDEYNDMMRDEYYDTVYDDMMADQLRDSAYDSYPPAVNQDGEEVVFEEESAVVSSVLDGDTIELSTGETVRLIGLNAPESGQPCFTEAKEFLQSLLLGQKITLERDSDNNDQYGRLLRYVFIKNSDEDVGNVNYRMIYLGYAHRYDVGSNTKYSSLLDDAERSAKEKGGCLWKSDEVNYVKDRCISIPNFHFNAAGNDNYNLNDEYVTFENKCSYSISLGGWTIKDETASHLYTIPPFTFKSGTKFTLYTGTGTNTNSALYWGRTSGNYAAIWNNGGDTLFLRDSDGNLVLSQSYSGY